MPLHTTGFYTFHTNQFLHSISTIYLYLKIVGTTIGPECFRFGIVILFDNSDHDGQIPISLQTLPERLRCPRADDGENTIESTRLFLCLIFS